MSLVCLTLFKGATIMCKNDSYPEIHCSLCQKRIRKAQAFVIDETSNHVAHSCCADWAAGLGKGNGTSVCADCGRSYIVAEHNFDEVRCASCQEIAADNDITYADQLIYCDSFADMLIGAYA